MKNIDELVFNAVFGDESVQKQSREEIRKLASENGIKSSSIQNLYMAEGRREVKGLTVPAINIRMMTYDTAQILFRLMMKHNVGPVIFEIAKSEQKYTDQKPDEYAVVVLAAAVKTGYAGPVFLQGDHYQFKASNFKLDRNKEIEEIKKLIKESIEAGFMNIDIDASTLVDLTKPTFDEQQKDNYEMTAMLTEYIRSLQPQGTMISVGGEIGHIGGKNSNVDEFKAFMNGYLKIIQNSESRIQNGISKVSVQTGTSHGGIPMADGTIAKVELDFNVLATIGKVAREKYHIGGPVQHGASTLPNELFGKFPETETLEIHLATGFQNIVYENMPSTLREEMNSWVKENLKAEWKEGQSEEQFVYKTRKKAIGPFKKKLWSLTEEEKKPIINGLEKQFEYLMEKLKVIGTREIVEKYV